MRRALFVSALGLDICLQSRTLWQTMTRLRISQCASIGLVVGIILSRGESYVSRQFCTGSVCVLCFFFAISAHAIPREWNQATGVTGYVTAGNWNPNGTPTNLDDVSFGPNLVGLDVDVVLAAAGFAVADNMTFTDGHVEFVGFGGVQLDNDGAVTIADVLATDLDDGALVTLNGTAGVAWTSAGDAFVGDGGYGSLTINNGGEFSANQILVGNQMGGAGQVTATGSGTTLTATRSANTGIFTIGNNGGEGTINIEAGAQMLTTTTDGNDFWIGSGFFDADPVDPLNPITPSVGTLHVDGVGSFAETDDINIGWEGGTGFINVTNGATIVLTDQDGGGDANFGSSFGPNGEKSTGTGVIDGDNSRIQARSFRVGFQGTGALTVSDGGEARSVTTGSFEGDVIIGDLAGSDGTMAVYGTATDGTTASKLDVDESLFVGRAGGLGVLRVGQHLDGTPVGTGRLEVDVDLSIGDDAGSNGDNAVHLAGNEVVAEIGIVLSVGRAGIGQLEVTSGATANTRFLRVGGVAGGEGTLVIDNAMLNATNNGGNSIVGFRGTGVATVRDGATMTTNSLWVGYDDDGDGTLTISNATVNIGQAPSDVGNLVIGGHFEGEGILGGTGVVTVENGGVLSATDEAYLGGNSNGDGTLIVRGASSQVIVGEADATSSINDTLRVGHAGAGLLDIGDGGEVIAEALAVTSVLNGGRGEIILGSDIAPGGTLEVRGTTRIGDADDGRLTVSNGATLITSSGGNHFAAIGDDTAAGGSLVTIDNATWNHMGTQRIDVGNFSNGTRSKLEVINGGTVTGSTTMFVANQANSTGELVVSGTGSSITGLTRLAMGDNGNGLMRIESGGEIAASAPTGFIQIGVASNGVGAATVAGVGSVLRANDYLSIGDNSSSQGTLIIEDGGTASTTSGHVYLGRSGSGTAGTVTVQDLDMADGSGGSLLSSGDSLFVGGRVGTQGGTGNLNVNAGGTVSVTNELIVYNTGTLNLNGGTIEMATLTIVSPPDFNFNTGTVRFTGDKTLNTTALTDLFGDIPNPTLSENQHLDIDGAATINKEVRLNGGALSVGSASPASLANVDWDAGTLQITAENLTVGAAGQLGPSLVVSSEQTLNVPGSGTSIDIEGGSDLSVIRGSLNATEVVNSGLLIVSNTSEVNFDSNDDGTGLTNDGDFVAIDATIAGAITNNGSLELVGTVDFTDGVTLSASSVLGVDLDGLSEFDELSVGGDFIMDGTLDLDVDFALSEGDAFEIVNIDGSQSGMFAGLADGALVGNFGGVDLFIDYDGGDGNDVVLFTASGADVDLDGDGDVDGSDFLALQRTNPSLLSDWANQYGSGSGALTASQAVPEPSTILMLVFTLAAACTRRSALRR